MSSAGDGPTAAPAPCDHDFVYAGVRYWDSDDALPGSSARERAYFDLYFCRRCLAQHTKRLPVKSNTYQELRFGATPLAASREEAAALLRAL